MPIVHLVKFWEGYMAQSAHATITADITTTSTIFVDATGLSVTLTTAGRDVLIWFSGCRSSSGNNEGMYTLANDGTNVGGTFGLAYDGGVGPYQIGFVWRIAAPTAGSHTYKIQWRTSAGTETLKGNPNATIVVQEI